MTEVDFNRIEQQQKDKQAYDDLLESTTYSLNRQQYDKLTSIATRYESLCSLIPNDTDSVLPNVICIFDSLNSSIFEFIETIQPNPIK